VSVSNTYEYEKNKHCEVFSSVCVTIISIKMKREDMKSRYDTLTSMDYPSALFSAS
jgi:hypothetical protein